MVLFLMLLLFQGLRQTVTYHVQMHDSALQVFTQTEGM